VSVATGAAGAAEDAGRVVHLPRFEERATVMGAAVNEAGQAESSMGVACGDYDADGWIDLMVTNFYMATNTLYRNLDGQGFDDTTRRAGLAAPSRDRLSWGTAFVDFENDGWLDLIVVSGHVDDVRWSPGKPPWAMLPQVFLNERTGRFRDVSRSAGTYFVQESLGRGLATGDLDHDGNIDVAVSHQLTRSAVLRNATAARCPSVIVKLIGRGASNRSAINARVEAAGLDGKTVREVVGGGSYLSASDRAVHIGLGSHQTIPKLRVLWPSGCVDEWPAVAPGRYVAIEQQGIYRCVVGR
jgi:hypothetical protein